MSNLILEFNPEYMTVRDLKNATDLLRDLVRSRERLANAVMPQAEREERFMNLFDTLTQNVEST